MVSTINQEHSVGDLPAGAGKAESPNAQWCVDIATRIGAGDSAAEAALVERLEPGLSLILKSRCGSDTHLAADLTQETLLILLKRLRSRALDDPSRIAAFAAQTARQLAFDSRRRFAIRRTVVDSEQVESTAIEAPNDDSVVDDSLVSLVRELLAKLPSDRDREVLRRFYFLDQDKAEICRLLNLAPGTFDQVIFRARGRMREMLEGRGLGRADLYCSVFLWVPKSWMN